MDSYEIYTAPFGFGGFLDTKLAEKHISIRELSRRSGVSPIHISNIIRGNRNPSDDVVLKLAQALEISPPESLLLRLGRVPRNRHDLLELLIYAFEREPQENMDIIGYMRTKSTMQKVKQAFPRWSNDQDERGTE